MIHHDSIHTNFKICYLFLGFLLAIISFVIVVVILLFFCTLILRQALCLDEDLPPQSHWRRQVSGLLVRLGGVEEVAEDAGQVVCHPVLLLQPTVVLYREDQRKLRPEMVEMCKFHKTSNSEAYFENA